MASLSTPAFTSADTMIGTILSKIAWPVFSGLAIVMLMVSGVMFLTANGDPARLKTARTALIYAIIGIVLGTLAYSIPLLLQGILSPS